jgi:hypothetical protein
VGERFGKDARLQQERRAEVQFLAHRLGQLEAAYRQTGDRLLLLVDPEGDLSASVRRVLRALDH